MILDGKEVSAKVLEETEIASGLFFKRFNRKPCLAVVLVGENPASLTYVSSKKKACEKVGFDHIDCVLPSDATQDAVLEEVEKLNENPKVDGILVQLPLPSHIDDNQIINSICREKDVDGFLSENLGALLMGKEGFIPCTPKGILRLLDYYGIGTDSKDVVVIGRSNIVGKPVAALLMQKNRNATVTVCHRKTVDLASKVRSADIVICAAGTAGLVTGDMIKHGAVVIDAGITRIPDSSKKAGYRIVGDAVFDEIKDKAFAISPVPGGVGPMTIAMLMENTLEAACRREGCEVSSL